MRYELIKELQLEDAVGNAGQSRRRTNGGA
jgi:hypothetical protein